MLAVAHRAGNDLDVLRAATAMGADIIEADVHLYRGRLEIRHQKSLGPLPWLWDKWQLYPASFPRPLLDGLFAALPAGQRLMLDLKGVGQVGPEVARALHALTEHPSVLVCARWWPSVRPFLDLPWAQVLLSARGHTELRRLRRRLLTGPIPYGVSVHLSMLTPSVVAQLQERGPLVLTWPVDDPESLARAQRIGVDGVITKDLAIVGQVASQRR